MKNIVKVEIRELYPLAFVALVNNLLDEKTENIKVNMEITPSLNIDVDLIIKDSYVSVIKGDDTTIKVRDKKECKPSRVVIDNEDYISLTIR